MSLAIATSKKSHESERVSPLDHVSHVYFPIEPISDADDYANLKAEIASLYPFDSNALDAARFWFGNPNTTVFWQSGVKPITDFIYDAFAEWDDEQEQSRRVTKRHPSLCWSHHRGLGDTNEAYEKFMEKANLCNPPLPPDELSSIWNSVCVWSESCITRRLHTS